MSSLPNEASAPQPTADDLLSLISIVGNPDEVITENHSKGDAEVKNASMYSDASPWQQTLTSFTSKRRQIILELQRLASSCQELKGGFLSSFSEFTSDDSGEHAGLHALDDVENAASTIRICATEYLQLLEEHMKSLESYWMDHTKNDMHSSSELASVGRQLASQLLRQLDWDEQLARGILNFLEDELYNDGISSNNATEKLRLWADAMSQMICIDKSFWCFVEREVYDEREIFERGDGAHDILNGGLSTQLITIESTLEAKPKYETRASLHERIISSASVEDAIKVFMDCDDNDRIRGTQSHVGSITSILIKGGEGCGKSYLLDSIQKSHASNRNTKKSTVKILRPRYPADLVGSTIGSSEDRFVALFSYASRIMTSTSEGGGATRCLIMLDDIDQMLSLSDDSNASESTADAAGGASTRSAQYFVGRRCKALFLTIMDAFRDQWPGGELLLLCTSRYSCDEIAGRFDRIFRRGLPDEKQRFQLIASCLSGDYNHDSVIRYAEEEIVHSEIQTLLSRNTHHSTGKSAYELSQYCREVLLATASSDSSKHSTYLERLQCLDEILQTKSPHSLRGGLLDGVVDMRVYTPEELQSRLMMNEDGTIKMPLLGNEAKRALDALMNVVVTPLCRSDEIIDLLHGGDGGGTAVDSKPIRVGVLLAGAPGVGKTSLAYHCASLAARITPRVSLLDVSCTSLIHKEIGESERAVQRLFAAVRAAAPCMLLLDGIENVAPKRGNDNTTEGTMDRVLSTFLTEMDGIESFCSAPGNVAVIGVTHYPDLVDPSLLRPGRLEKIVRLGPPDSGARKEIVEDQIKDIDIDFTSAGYFDAKSKDDLARYLAMGSTGMSAMEVIAICKEASMECLRKLDFEDVSVTTRPKLTPEHFETAMGTVKGRMAMRK